MTPDHFTRREALRRVGATLAVGAFAPEAGAAAEGPAIIDAHAHLVNSNLPGSSDKSATDAETPLGPFSEAADDARRRLAAAVSREMTGAGVTDLLAMPRLEVSDADPLGVGESLSLAGLLDGPRLHAVGLMHPERFDADHLARVEAELKRGRVKALKAYLGYTHYGPSWRGYMPYYELAAAHGVPVIFHTGDTYSKVAKVRFAHPLYIDEVAVDFPKTNFVMAHFGNPWIMSASELLYKNDNLWADLSGILVGSADYYAAMHRDGSLARVAERIKAGIAFAETAEKFLFGSDWPLSPVAPYRDFVRMMFPEKEHQAVFHDNAKKLFRL